MKPETTESSLTPTTPRPHLWSHSPARAFYTNHHAGPVSAADSPARAHTCPKTGQHGQCGQVRAH